jgi:hypothetical protein
LGRSCNFAPSAVLAPDARSLTEVAGYGTQQTLDAVLHCPLESIEQTEPEVPHWLAFVQGSRQMLPLPKSLRLAHSPDTLQPEGPAQSYEAPSLGLQTKGPMGLPLASVAGAQHPFVMPVCPENEHSVFGAVAVPCVQRHRWPFKVPGGKHAPVAEKPVPVSPATKVQQPLAVGQVLLVEHFCAHDLLPVPSSTQTEPASQQLAAQGV